MRKIREVLRLHWGLGVSWRLIAQSCSVARSTVGEYVRRAQEAGLSWPLPQELDDGELERRLFPPRPAIASEERVLPDWFEIHREMKRKGVTLFLLWQEYRAVYPEGYQYSRFCDLYRAWRGRQSVVMRQTHRAGEKLFVDYAGQTVPIVDPKSGQIREAQVFVAVLGASNYAYAEATWTQSLPDWIASHVRTFKYLNGVVEILVPDNTKTGVTSPHLYEPDLNATYQDMARHYNVAVVPARVRRPKDKAKVEAGVQVVERWILARLRHRTFFSLDELNRAIAELLFDLNNRPFQKLPGSRRSLFEELDRPALRPLPVEPYEYAEWKKARVHIDYHVEVDRHFYSVPYQLVGQELDVRLSANTVEMFHRGKRIASHQRSHRVGGYTTLADHMPAAHRHYAEWTPERLVRWAGEAGGAVSKLVEAILSSRPHPQQGFRSCLGIMRLGKKYGPERLEAACRRALHLKSYRYKSVESILKNGLENQPLPGTKTAAGPVMRHANVRGAEYFSESLFPFSEGGERKPC
jgi:transposase